MKTVDVEQTEPTWKEKRQQKFYDDMKKISKLITILTRVIHRIRTAKDRINMNCRS